MEAQKGLSGIVAAYLAKQYGGLFNVEVSFPTIGTTSVQLLENNPDRPAFAVINTSANNIWLQPLKQQTGQTGIFLSANGGFATINMRDDLILPAYEWWVVAAAAGSSITVVELESYGVVSP